ncbi:unnamed protein product [Durusdinium trenchii]|uniref:Uncharacterized protein n=1 Tax=Durusdinium trenchii TaxID=1381693 RepID=A0ABP0IZF8_9DINO
MWAPFFDLPKDLGCECTGSSAHPDEEAPAVRDESEPKATAKVPQTSAASAPLRPGTVGLGSHAPELKIAGLRIRGGTEEQTATIREGSARRHGLMIDTVTPSKTP